MGLSDVQPDNQKHGWQPRLALGTEVEGCLGIEPSAYWNLMVSEMSWIVRHPVGVRELVMACGESEPTLCLDRAVFVHAKVSCVWFFVTLWTLALQAPLSMGFSRQEHWSRLPFPPPGDLLNPGIEPLSPGLAGRFFTTSTTWEAQVLVLFVPCIIEPRQTHLFGIVSSSVSQRVYWAPTECKEICLWSDPTTSCNLESHYLRTSTNLYTAGGGTHTKPRTEKTGVRGDWWRDVHSGWFQRGN